MDRSLKATHQETRAHNERLVLGTIYDRGPISRAEVARVTNLTRTTVSDVVTGLIDSGLTREIGRGPSTGGKAPILLEVDRASRHVIGIDLGDKVFRGGIVDLRGDTVLSRQLSVEDRDADRALARMFELIDGLMAAREGRLLGIGIGTAGLIDASSGTVLQAVNLDWRQLPLGRILSDRYGVPVQIANDSQAAALAEHLFGRLRTDNLIVVKVGQGIGAGLVLDGRLFQGDGYGAGEIGHTAIGDGGELCRCGSVGCLETIASSRAILSRLVALGWPASGEPFELDDVVAAFHAGDETVVDVALEAARAIGIALGGLIGALNVNRIVIVGSVAAFGERWLQAIRDAACRRALPLLARDTVIEIGSVADEIVVRGASALLLTRELGLNVASTAAGPSASPRERARAKEARTPSTQALTADDIPVSPVDRVRGTGKSKTHEVAVAREVGRD